VLKNEKGIFVLIFNLFQMIQTGTYFEKIVEMLNAFRTEVHTCSTLGLLNINKHSENFIKTILNLTYGYELENLNIGKSNFPGIDIGDSGEGIAFQVTSTKKSEKIDDTLITCLKYKHYETFKTINIFILTSKQSSYTLKTITEPHFAFSPEINIFDFSDLLRDIENIGTRQIKAIYEFVDSELQPTIKLINEEANEKRELVNIAEGASKSNMPYYYRWQSILLTKNKNATVPEIYTALNKFFSSPILISQFLPILNHVFRITNSSKEVFYCNNISGSGVSNYFHGEALLIENSSLTTERVVYSNDRILINLLPEMLSLITEILFLFKQSTNEFEVEISITLDSNIETLFHPNFSLVSNQVLNSYGLESSFVMHEKLTDIKTSTLRELLQKIIHGFICQKPNFLANEPFLTIDSEKTESSIDGIKNCLNITD